jgi:hypothetical protein
MVLSCRDVKALLTSSSTMSSRSSRLRMPEVDAPLLQGEGATGGRPLPFGSIQLRNRIGGGSFTRVGGRSITRVGGRLFTTKCRIIRPVPGRSLRPTQASLHWLRSIWWGRDTGHADAGSAAVHDLDLGLLFRSGCP